MFIALHTLEPNMIWSSVVVLKFKMVISSGEFLFFGLIGREKGKKWQKLCLLCFVSQEPYIIWSSFMVHMCKKIISPKVFFHFLKILIYWVNYFISVVKRAKNGPKWQKRYLFHSISQKAYIIMIMILGSKNFNFVVC